MLVLIFFFNLDQTKWNNINVSSTTIHIKGMQSKVNILGNEKEGFTLTLIISYGGTMLKPILTTKGKTKFIKNEAIKRNIKLIYVPKGLTSTFQPLDILINGILKQKAKKLWRQEIIKDPDMKIKNSDAVKHFLQAKKSITSKIITKSFDISCFI
jgi:hypothetical protein